MVQPLYLKSQFSFNGESLFFCCSDDTKMFTVVADGARIATNLRLKQFVDHSQCFWLLALKKLKPNNLLDVEEEKTFFVTMMHANENKWDLSNRHVGIQS